MPECSRMLQDTNAYWTPLQRQLNCQLNPHQTQSPEKASKSLWILQLAQPVHFKAFRGRILWLGSHSSQSSTTRKVITYYNILQLGFGFLNVISSGLWWSTYGTFSKLTWPFWVQMGATWSYMEQHHLSKHIQTIWQCVKTLYPWWTSK